MDFPASKYVIVKAEILPPVYLKVLQAKKMLADGEVASAVQAARLCGVSRSAYYKYKDGIFEYDQQNGGEMLTLSLKLKDTKGVLSAVTAELYRRGANVLSINQSVPKNGVADVSLLLNAFAAWDASVELLLLEFTISLLHTSSITR